MRLGQVVISKAGRDSGRLYLVVGLDEGGLVAFLSDGRHRPVERPKRKNPLHLQPTGFVDAEASRKAASGTLTDLDVRRALRDFSESRGGDRVDA